MKNISSVNELYAKAIVDIAKCYNIEQTLLNDLQLIKDCFTSSLDLFPWLSLPSINKNKKLEVLNSVLKDKVNPFTMRIINILVNKSRLYLLPELYESVKKEIENRAAIVKVVLTSAIPLDDELKEKYKNKIKKIFNREPEIEYIVDKSIIGGCRIKGDEKIIDCSIATELNKLRKKLIEN